MPLHWIFPNDPPNAFPEVDRALTNPEGLLAVGGDLRSERLLEAYRRGIFPWYEAGQPILWWSPGPRTVLIPDRIHITRSLRKTLRNRPWSIRFDNRFRDTITGCAAPRRSGSGTWITPAMLEAYCRLHDQGYAHSVEVYDEAGSLVGGLYGIALGRVFFGESMFSRRSDASKVAMVHLARHLHHWGFMLIDCQLASEHIMSLGAELMPRTEFVTALRRWVENATAEFVWEPDPNLDVAGWHPDSS